MHSSLTGIFYGRRRILLGMACASPLVLLAGVWWLVNDVLLVPALPDARATAQQCVEFIVHAKGLPRLDTERQIAFVEAEMRRFLEDEGFRDSFVAALRRSTKDEKTAFRAHVLNALKPRVVRDVREFHGLPDEARTAVLDEQLVDYKRLEMLLRTLRLDRQAFGDALPDKLALFNLVVSKTTADERALCLAYMSALARRADAILKEPELKRQFERRLGSPLP